MSAIAMGPGHFARGSVFSSNDVADILRLTKALPTPCYVLDEQQIIANCQMLRAIQERTGCKILLAQKCFSNFNLYPLMQEYLAGTEASGLYESRLGREEMPDRENHVYCGAYRDDQFEELLDYADHIIFNSIGQLAKFGPRAKQAGKSVGVRINPECSTQEGHDIYDPCSPGSRLGITKAVWDERMTPELLALLDGLHFHSLCQQNSDALEVTLEKFEANFGEFLPAMKWLNVGGGHHITRVDYDVPRLEKHLVRLRDAYGLQVYVEPGEAVVLNAGYIISTVLDLNRNGDVNTGIVDFSAACHCPDVVEMPFTPPLLAAGEPEKYPYSCRLGGPTCLAGDNIGYYGFAAPLTIGQRLVFADMALYTTNKNNTFNGMPLPPIYTLHPDGTVDLLAEFGYDDFKYRLGKCK